MTDPKASPAWAKLGLLLILALDLWWRGHTIGPTVRERLGVAPWPVVVGEAEPLDCDEAAYAYIGRGLARGSVMYRDLSENKPPLGYWLYTLAVAVGGADELTIRLMPIPYVLATIALVWWIGLRLRGPTAACLAALLYALLSTDPYLFGNGANMEHFLNLFAVASLAATVRAFEVPGRRRLFVAGAFVAAASMVKQVAALHGLVYALALILVDRRARGDAHRGMARLRDLAALALGFAAPWLVAAVVLWLQGAGADAFEDIVGYGSALATAKVADPNAPPKLLRWIVGNSDPLGKLPWPFGRTNYLVWWGTGSWPAWLAAAPALAWMVVGRGADRARRLVAAWTLSAWVQVALPGLFWQHYYLLPTPGLALALAVAMADSGAAIGPAIRARELGRATLAAAAGLGLLAAEGETARIQVRDYLLVPPEQLTARYKGGQQWIALRALGREIGRRSASWDRPTLYVWGWQSPLLIYSGLDCPTRHFFADPLLEDYARGHHRDHPRVRPRVERIMRDLEGHPPALVLAAHPPFPPLRRFLDRGYLRSALPGLGVTSPDGVGLWVARDHFAAFESATAPPRAAQKAGATTGTGRSATAR